MTKTTIRRALISVSDKTGLLEFAKALTEGGVHLVSTGSTAATIRDAGMDVTEVAQVTGFPEALDGRVKTLHPSIHGGILADRRLDSHRAQLDELGIEAFDLVAVNLYPFEATISRGADFDEAIENIDIGGPAMVRAAAKNHASVAIVVDPSDYDAIVEQINTGGVSLETRTALAQKAFAHTAGYDSLVASWLAGQIGHTAVHDGVTMAARLRGELRYGENSHQSAALYERPGAPEGLAQAEIIQGKAMSFNNYLDANAALDAAFDHEGPAVAIIKHQNPCGIATGESLIEAYRAAHACDPVSALAESLLSTASSTQKPQQQSRRCSPKWWSRRRYLPRLRRRSRRRKTSELHCCPKALLERHGTFASSRAVFSCRSAICHLLPPASGSSSQGKRPTPRLCRRWSLPGGQ